MMPSLRGFKGDGHISIMFLVLLVFIWIEGNSFDVVFMSDRYILAINSNSNHRATSTIPYLGCKYIFYQKISRKFVLSHLWEELSIQRYNTMKPYEYMKYSYQNNLEELILWAFTSNNEKILCIVTSVPRVSLMYLLPGSFFSIQEVIRCFMH